MRLNNATADNDWTSQSRDDVVDFIPGLLSIEQHPPSPLGRRFLHALLLMFIILLAGSAIGRVDITTTAEGKLIPATWLKIVQPSDGGIVSQILVREGETVHKGDLLIRMDPGYAEADTRELANSIAQRRIQLRRIDAELKGGDLQQAPDDPDDLFQAALAQLKAHRQAYQDQLHQARAAINKTWADLVANRAGQERLEKTLPSLRTEERAYEQLSSQGYASMVDMYQRQRARIEAQQDLRDQQVQARSLAAALDGDVQQLALVTGNYRQTLENERVEAETDLKKLEQEWAKQQHRNALMELRAPADGIIKDVSVHTIGAVAQPGTVLMTLVPTGVPLRAEVWVQNQDVGFVRRGQKVRLKFATYPFQRYGTLDGIVDTVAADANDAGNGAGNTNSSAGAANGTDKASPALAYRTEVTLSDQSLTHAGTRLRLTPGMEVTADIRLGDQTVLQYLLSPLKKAVESAGHER